MKLSPLIRDLIIVLLSFITLGFVTADIVHIAQVLPDELNRQPFITYTITFILWCCIAIVWFVNTLIILSLFRTTRMTARKNLPFGRK